MTNTRHRSELAFVFMYNALHNDAIIFQLWPALYIEINWPNFPFWSKGGWCSEFIAALSIQREVPSGAQRSCWSAAMACRFSEAKSERSLEVWVASWCLVYAPGGLAWECILIRPLSVAGRNVFLNSSVWQWSHILPFCVPALRCSPVFPLHGSCLKTHFGSGSFPTWHGLFY